MRLRERRGKPGHLLVGQPVKVAHVTARFSNRGSRDAQESNAS